jgi:hypothetical protein
MATTNLQERKLDLIQWLSVTDDALLIEKVAKVRDDSVSDWWNEISEAERESSATGKEDADSGSLTAHSKVRGIFKNLAVI